jgi:mono/diheme cytochrome c family protein
VARVPGPDTKEAVMALTRKAVWVGVGILILCCAQTAAGQTIKREPAQPLRTVDGAENYQRYCAACHGKDLKGHGPAATALKAAPTDLTTFAKRHGGTFSGTDLETSITGKGQPIPAHGTEDMPIWGPIFKSMSPDDGNLALRIANLVKFIESAQAK